MTPLWKYNYKLLLGQLKTHLEKSVECFFSNQKPHYKSLVIKFHSKYLDVFVRFFEGKLTLSVLV